MANIYASRPPVNLFSFTRLEMIVNSHGYLINISIFMAELRHVIQMSLRDATYFFPFLLPSSIPSPSSNTDSKQDGKGSREWGHLRVRVLEGRKAAWGKRAGHEVEKNGCWIEEKTLLGREP